MKKMILAIVAGLLLFVTVQGFKGGTGKGAGELPVADTIIRPTGFQPSREYYMAFYDTANKPLEGLLTADIANEMSKLYSNDVRKSTIDGKKKNSSNLDATSIWFDLNTLKNYIARIEGSLKGAQCAPRLGIRIYYAKYPQNLDRNRLADLSDSVKGRHTVFMIPTYDISLDNHIDFSIDTIGSNPCQPVPFYKLIGINRKTPIVFVPGVTRETYVNASGHGVYRVGDESALNHGGLAPPPAGTGTFPTPSSDGTTLRIRNR